MNNGINPLGPTANGPVPDEPLHALAENYLGLLLTGNRQGARLLVDNALRGGASIRDVYMQVFEGSQHEIGRRWQANKITVAQEHFCTAATQLIMAQLYGQVLPKTRKPLTLLVAAVGDELHELGARMVSDFFEMDGWRTFYAGANVSQENVIRMVRDRKPSLLGLSATMTFHVEHVRKLILAVRASDDCRNTPILVGGRSFNMNPELWRQVKADGWARNADEAVSVANRLLIA